MSNSIDVCQLYYIFCLILDTPSNKLPKTFNLLPKWQNFAKSGLTGGKQYFAQLCSDTSPYKVIEYSMVKLLSLKHIQKYCSPCMATLHTSLTIGPIVLLISFL